MSQDFDASRSLTALEQDNTLIAVIEMGQAKWLVRAVVPGIERQPLKRLDADEEALLKLLYRWRAEAGHAPASSASSSLMRLAATAFGLPAGCGHAISRPT